MTLTTPPRRLERRARQLAWLTIGWNVTEAVVAIAAGAAASSVALVGFGLDSTVEVASASVITWQLRGVARHREARALQLIAISFFALAGYVTIQAVVDLAGGHEPSSSPLGIGLAVASLAVMPTLAAAKRRNGRRMHSRSVLADSRQTQLCAYLSAALLAGLVLNSAFSWWWADPLTALVIAALASHEGREIWRGDSCCD